MAYVSNDIEETIRQIPIGANNEIWVKRILTKDMDFKAIDVRRYYLDNKTNKMAPTTKGIRCNYDVLADVVSAILMACNEDVMQTLLTEHNIQIEKLDS